MLAVAVMTCIAFIIVSFVPVSADQNSVQLPKTGQIISDTAGGPDPRDDGQLQMGVAWSVPRFVDNNDGTVTDRLTNLVWLKNGNCYGDVTWYQALACANAIETGDCGLSDNSKKGDWRLPNRNEMLSLVDAGRSIPSLPAGHPFTNVTEGKYWTSTSLTDHADAWIVYMYDGSCYSAGKSYVIELMWPIRDIRKGHFRK